MNNENLDERIKDILGDVKEGGLIKDSIVMIICLENDIDRLESEIDMAESAIRLIKDKKMFATYEGDRDKPYDVDQFRVTLEENDKDQLNN